MITRLVKLSFKPEFANEFESLFDTVKEEIANFPGCLHLELYKETTATVFFTHSVWESEAALEQYRNSTFFASTWKKTKTYFSEPAQAWTLERFGPG